MISLDVVLLTNHFLPFDYALVRTIPDFVTFLTPLNGILRIYRFIFWGGMRSVANEKMPILAICLFTKRGVA